MIDLAKLKEPFPPDRISWRVGSTNKEKTKGMALAYIDARDVQDRLDDVCGPGNWQCRYSHATDKKTVCEIGLLLNSEWVWKADGAGDTDVEAEKGALSDAFKRAAVRWGVGRYLYDLDSPWVDLEERGRSYVIKPGEIARLSRVAGGSSRPAAVPSVTPPPVTASANPKPRMTPEEWATKAKADLLACSTLEQCSAWHHANYNAMVKLDLEHPELFEGVVKVQRAREHYLKGVAA